MKNLIKFLTIAIWAMLFIALGSAVYSCCQDDEISLEVVKETKMVTEHHGMWERYKILTESGLRLSLDHTSRAFDKAHKGDTLVLWGGGVKEVRYKK